MDDTKNQIAGYFQDSLESYVADHLAEEVMNHASILSWCNAANTFLRLVEHANINEVPPDYKASGIISGL